MRSMTLKYAVHSLSLMVGNLFHLNYFTNELFHKYISQIKGETLNAFMVEINRIVMREGKVEDGRSIRTDSTVVETDIHYPTNNELMWDCIKV